MTGNENWVQAVKAACPISIEARPATGKRLHPSQRRGALGVGVQRHHPLWVVPTDIADA